MTNNQTKMAWEQHYDDGSGVEFAVRYNNDEEEAIEFYSCADNTASFPFSKIDWLISCLQKIRDEQKIPL